MSNTTKLILTLLLLFLLLISSSIYLRTLNIRPYFFPLLQPQSQSSLPSCSPLKVFMYDLPRRFHVGMLDHKETEEVVTAKNLPLWPKNRGVRKQHSVEYWLMGSLLYEGNEEREAVRVSDPENAEVDLLDFLWKSKYWQRSGGRDHVIPMTHPNAFRFLRQELNASILIVADFGRYPKSLSTLRKDVVSPYVHVVDSFTDVNVSDPYESRKTLLFFRGNTIRKDEGKVRVQLAKILAGYDDVLYERSSPTTETIKASTQGMRSSKFCLSPAGDTPSSCRLFDAIVSHCVPVIVSDQIELPYEDEIDYNQFSVFFSVKEAIQPGYLVNQLRQIPKQRWLEMWNQLKNVSHHFEFQYPPKKDDAVNMLWRQVKHKVPDVQLAVHRSHRLKVPDWWSRRR